MKFAHISDVHLGRRPDDRCVWAEEAQQEIYDGFVAFIDEMLLDPVDFIFVTGDLFDHVPTKNDLQWVDAQFAKLQGTNIIYITGEADYLERNSALWKYNFLSNTYLLNTEPFNNRVKEEEKPQRTNYADGVVDCIYFPKYNLDIYGVCQYNKQNDRNDFDTLYAHDTSRISILLGHGGSERVSPFDLADLKGKGFQYVGVGHYHNFERFEKENMCYAGALSPLEPEEEGPHGYVKGYADGLIASCKFVEIKNREYKTLVMETENDTTNEQLLSAIEEICKKKKHCIYSIEIKRSDRCFMDYDLSSLHKKYRIYSIEGEKTFNVDVEQLQEMNNENAIGQRIRHIAEMDSSDSFEAKNSYASKIMELLKQETNPSTQEDEGKHKEQEEQQIFKVAAEKAKKIDEEAIEFYKKEVVVISQGLDICKDSIRKNEAELKKYPDHTGNMNVLREKRRAVQHELDKVTFEEQQINKNYVARRLKVVLWMVTPFVLIISYLCTFGLAVVFFKMQWEAWLKFLEYLLAFMIAFGFAGMKIYDKTQKWRNKKFGTKIPAMEHVRLGNLIEEFEVELDKIDMELQTLTIDQEKHQKLKKEEKELMERQNSLVQKFHVINLILS